MRRVNLLLGLGVLSFVLVLGCAKKEVKIVAKVGDRKITVEDLENEYRQESRLIIQGRSELDRRRDALNKLIRDQVVIIGAYKEGLDKEVENDTTLKKQKDQILLNELGKKEIVDKSKASEQEIKSQYDKMKEEIHAGHILVETKEQADSIYQKLKEGADFAEMAKEKSIDPSAKTNAGDLGFFGWGRMIPEFQEVAFKLKDGEISRPVKTTYGWHIIKLVERREANQPPYEEAKEMIRAQLEREKNQKRVTEYFEELKKKVNFKLNEKALDLLISKKTETSPDTLGLKRREYQFDMDEFTDEEKNMSLFTYKGGQTTVGAFMDQFNSMPAMYRPRLDDKEELEKVAFQSIVPEIVLKEARDQKLEKTKDFKENWQKFLEQKMAEKMRSEVILKDVVVTDEDIQSYYDKHPERYEKPAEVHIKEILVKTEPEASDILKQLKKKADFDKLAQERTIRPDVKNQGGDLGSFTRPRYPELFDAALPMKEGELKGPIKIMDRQFGESYAVIKLIEKKEAQKAPLDEIKTQVATQARNEKNNQTFNLWVEDQKAKLPIEINEEVLKSTVKEGVEKEGKTEGKG
ncbi:MAG: peptidylprolyl isomerase [candidate division Zixibacteria bacterium]|nr:peptidylprolyl isomerase [candidate division Zixibacteria bacterium]